MQKTLKISWPAIAAVAIGLMLVLAMQSAPASANDGEDHSKDKSVSSEQNPKSDEQESANSVLGDYSYKARAGDSYSAMARKAVQTYGINNEVSLTRAGIIFAETNITRDADAQLLAVGQEVTIPAEAVQKYVKAAGKLSKAEQKAWAVYVPGVDFNTDDVGQE